MTSSSPPEFEVRPFAFMRLTHEAIRAARDRVVALAELHADHAQADDLDACRALFADTVRCIELHAGQEEGGFFPLLDGRFDGAARRAGFRDEHEEERAGIARVEDALLRARTEPGEEARRALRDAARAWAAANEAHLLHEEEIMMPLTQEVADTPEGRAAAVREIIDAGDRAAAEAWQFGWVAARLAAHRPFGPLRMYVSALRLIHGEEFGRFEPTLRAALPDETVTRLAQVGALG